GACIHRGKSVVRERVVERGLVHGRGHVLHQVEVVEPHVSHIVGIIPSPAVALHGGDHAAVQPAGPAVSGNIRVCLCDGLCDGAAVVGKFNGHAHGHKPPVPGGKGVGRVAGG